MRESKGIIYPRTAAERAMKLQEVLFRATAGNQVVAGSGVDGHQLASDATMAEAV